MQLPVPSQVSCSPVQQPHALFAPHGPYNVEHEHIPPSGAGPICGTHVHWAVWLCVVISWYGIQNATRDGSMLPCASDRLIGAIQSCGSWHWAAKVCRCGAPGVS